MVKYAPRKVYIRESGGYVELSYTEFCRCREVKQWGAAKKMPGKSKCNDDSQLSHGDFRSHFTGAIDLKNSLSRPNHNGYGTACTCY